MNAKEYLKQAYYIDRKIELDREKLAKMESSLYGKSIRYDSDGAAHTASSDNSLEKAIAKVADYRAKINDEIDRLVNVRLEIEAAIEHVPDAVQREVLTRRYLLYQKWERIAVDMNLDLRWVYRLHGKALSKLAIESHCFSVI